MHDPTSGLSAADLTGDGRCEVVVAGQAPSGKARATAIDGAGKTVWHVDGDGRGEILVICEDGMLYCLDQASGRTTRR